MASDPKELAARLRRHEVIKRHPKGALCVAVHPDCAQAADMLEALAAERDAAWKAGAEAMREDAEEGFSALYGDGKIEADEAARAIKVIRALPIPTREGGDA